MKNVFNVTTVLPHNFLQTNPCIRHNFSTQVFRKRAAQLHYVGRELRYIFWPPLEARKCSETRNTMGEKCPVILSKCRLPRYIQGFFPCCKSATWDRRLYFPSEGRRAEDFFVLKNPTASSGFKPANLGSKGHHAYP